MIKSRLIPKPDCWKKLTWTVPVIDRILLDDPNAAAQDGILFAGRDISWFIEKDTLEKELHRVRTAIGSLESRIPSLSEQGRRPAPETARWCLNIWNPPADMVCGYGNWRSLKRAARTSGKRWMRRRLKKSERRAAWKSWKEQSALAGQLGEQGGTAVRIKADGCLLGRVWSAEKRQLKGLNEDRQS